MLQLFKVLLIDVAIVVGKLLLDEVKKPPVESRNNNQQKEEGKV